MGDHSKSYAYPFRAALKATHAYANHKVNDYVCQVLNLLALTNRVGSGGFASRQRYTPRPPAMRKLTTSAVVCQARNALEADFLVSAGVLRAKAR